MHPAENVGEHECLAGVVVDEIAGEDYQVSLAGVDGIDDILYHFGVGAERSEVQVRKLYDAVAVEGGRQCGVTVGVFLHNDVAVAGGESVYHGTEDDAAGYVGASADSAFCVRPVAAQ